MGRITFNETEQAIAKGYMKGELEPYNMPGEYVDAAAALVDKAEALCAELNAYDEMDDDLWGWYFRKYYEQEGIDPDKL